MSASPAAARRRWRRHPTAAERVAIAAAARAEQTRRRDARAKERCELHLIDFIELMWPILDPTQPFVRGEVQEAICQHLEAVSDGLITKLGINVPPGFTKSRIVSVCWPAWEWGPRNRPDLRYMLWSYSDELAEDQNNDCRKIIESEVYQRLWGDRFAIDGNSDAKSYYKNDKLGWRRSSSIMGQGTGYRADRLIFDDPHPVKSADSTAALVAGTRWFARTLPTRVRNAGGDVKVKVPFWVREVHGNLEEDPDDDRPILASATVGIGQRVHLHDIFGMILRNPALGYEMLIIEMRWKGADHPARRSPTWKPSSIGWQDWRTEPGQLADPVRYPLESVDAIEAQMMLDGGKDAVAAQHDQWPIEESGTWFKTEWLPIIEPHEVPKDVGHGKRGWDFGGGGTSASADPTASARVSRGPSDRRFYLWHTATQGGSPGQQEQFIAKQHREDPAQIDWSIPEDPGTGKNYATYIKSTCAGRFVASSPEQKDKVTRAKPVSSQAEIGMLAIVRHPGCELARAELVDFPYGDHDDIVDAISRAFAAVIADVPAAPTSFGGFTFQRS